MHLVVHTVRFRFHRGGYRTCRCSLRRNKEEGRWSSAPTSHDHPELNMLSSSGPRATRYFRRGFVASCTSGSDVLSICCLCSPTCFMDHTTHITIIAAARPKAATESSEYPVSFVQASSCSQTFGCPVTQQLHTESAWRKYRNSQESHLITRHFAVPSLYPNPNTTTHVVGVRQAPSIVYLVQLFMKGVYSTVFNSSPDRKGIVLIVLLL